MLFQTEKELVNVLEKWLQDRGYYTKREVRMKGYPGWADLFFWKGAERGIIEAKLKLSVRVMAQAEAWVRSGFSIFAATPLYASASSKDAEFLEKTLLKHGVRLLYVSLNTIREVRGPHSASLFRYELHKNEPRRPRKRAYRKPPLCFSTPQPVNFTMEIQ